MLPPSVLTCKSEIRWKERQYECILRESTLTFFVRIDDVSRKPVGRHALLHLNLQSARDGALHVIPSDVDDAFACICKSDKTFFEKIEVVLATTRALVNDLYSVRKRFKRGSRQCANHGYYAAVIGASDFDAASTSFAVVPIRVAERSTVDPVWDCIGREAAHSALRVASIECCLPRKCCGR